jgi:signal transduction histidine kinase
VLRDITLRKEREQELDLMRQVQSRVLRHNIRNDLQLVKLTTAMLADKLDGQDSTMAERAYDRADDLVSISTKARAVEKLVEQDQIPTRIDLSETLNAILERSQQDFPDISFHIDAPETCSVEIIPAIEIAFENIIENAAEHNDSATPTVHITVQAESERATVTIRDNGDGIPSHELTVLDKGEETPLEHGSGIGLWVIQWVLDNSTATMDYTTSEDGTTFSIHIPTLGSKSG